MPQSEFILCVAKLCGGALTCILALLLWSRTHDGAYMCLVAGVLVGYAGVIYDILVGMGLVVQEQLVLFGIPVLTLAFWAVPCLLFIAAFILLLWKCRR